VENHNGKLPADHEKLLALAGIGPYTAAAIASMAFDQPYAAVDGNLERVLARVLGYREIAKGAAPIQSLAQALVQLGRPGDINEALMDLSATVCKVKQPSCNHCPLLKNCVARKTGSQAEIPQRAQKAKTIELHAAGILLLRRAKSRVSARQSNKAENSGWEFYIAKRPAKTWLAGQWDIPWWIADRESAPAIRNSRKIGRSTVKRTITKHKIIFAVDGLVLNDSGTKIPQRLQAFGDSGQWRQLDDLSGLPRPTVKALQKIIDQHLK